MELATKGRDEPIKLQASLRLNDGDASGVHVWHNGPRLLRCKPHGWVQSTYGRAAMAAIPSPCTQQPCAAACILLL
ncbi:hypothetical protein SESBI_01048 [Sesbania bispinosa]|nr:hypothetical protein SESBI_01048 [Sesbania bispinosa]